MHEAARRARREREQRPGEAVPSSSHDAADIVLRLQRTAGNTAVARLLQAQAPTLARWGPFGFGVARDPFPDVSDDDIKWIDGLSKPPNIKAQIDTGFAAGAERKAVGKLEAAEAGEVKKAERRLKPGAARDEAIEQIREESQEQIEAKHQAFASGRESHRKEFLRNMRELLGPDPATENHFSAFDEVEGSPNLFLHRDAARRMKQVRQDLKNQNTDLELPQTTVGQALRGRHLGQVPGKGKLGHPLGFSIDYDAAANPRLGGDPKELGPQRIALVRLFSGDPTHLKLHPPGKAGADEWSYQGRREFLKGIGKRASAGEDVEADPRFKAFLSEFEEQFRKMEEASDRFKQSLPAANVAELRTLKDRYEKALVGLRPVNSALAGLDAKLVAARKSARAAVAKRDHVKASEVSPEDVDAEQKVAELLEARAPLAEKKEELDAEKDAVRAGLKPVFQPWLDKIQEKIDPIRERAAKEGVALEEAPSEEELKALVKTLRTLDGLEKKLVAKPKSKSAAAWRKKADELRGQVGSAVEKLDKSLGPAAAPAGAGPVPASVRLEQAKKLEPWRLPRKELGIWTSLSKNLTENAHFVFGGLDEEHPDRLKLEAGDPSVAQLLGALDLPKRATDEGGFFNPDPEEERDGFNFRFFKTMIKHGFDPGAAWAHGSTDPMHFDFAEGWDKFVK